MQTAGDRRAEAVSGRETRMGGASAGPTVGFLFDGPGVMTNMAWFKPG